MKQYATYEANDSKVYCYKCENFIEKKMWGDFYYEIGYSKGIIHRFGSNKFVSDAWDDIFEFISFCVWTYNKAVKDSKDYIDDFQKELNQSFTEDRFLSFIWLINGWGIRAIQEPRMYDKTTIARYTSGITFTDIADKGKYKSLNNTNGYCFPLGWNEVGIKTIKKIDLMREIPDTTFPEAKIIGDSSSISIDLLPPHNRCLKTFLCFCGKYFSDFERPFDNISLIYKNFEWNGTVSKIPYYKFEVKDINDSIYRLIENFKLITK